MGAEYRYKVDLIAQTKLFEQNMQKATTEANKFTGAVTNVNTSGNKLSSSMGMVGKGMGELALMIGGPVAGLSLLTGSIQAIEGPGNKLKEVVGGGKDALFEFQRALVTLDFNDFFTNLREGYIRGKEFAAAMAELMDEQAYTSYSTSLLRVQSSELRETIRNQRLDIAERTKAANDRNEIEEQIKKKTTAFAKDEFEVTAGYWTKKNKVDSDQAIKAYEIYSDIDKSKQELFNKARDLAGNQYYGKVAAGELIAWQKRELIAKGVTQTELDAMLTINKLTNGEADVWVKLFGTYQKYNETVAGANERFSLSNREQSMLLNQQERGLDKVIVRKKALNKISGITKVGQLGTTITTPNNLAPGPSMPKPEPGKGPDPWDKLTEKMALIADYPEMIDDIKTSFGEMFGSLAAGGDSFDEMAMNFKKAAKSMVGDAISLAISFVILDLFKDAVKKGGFLGLVVAPALAAAGAGLAKTAFNSLLPKFADGGLAYGPTVGMMGEYPGAKSNPEVIAPLSKLQSMLQPSGMAGEVVFRIGERELTGVLVRSNRIQRNIRGRG